MHTSINPVAVVLGAVAVVLGAVAPRTQKSHGRALARLMREELAAGHPAHLSHRDCLPTHLPTRPPAHPSARPPAPALCSRGRARPCEAV
eukprot:366090-Chlamydomonas_euryale.AAC.8